jgi:hypothetical protein
LLSTLLCVSSTCRFFGNKSVIIIIIRVMTFVVQTKEEKIKMMSQILMNEQNSFCNWNHPVQRFISWLWPFELLSYRVFSCYQKSCHLCIIMWFVCFIYRTVKNCEIFKLQSDWQSCWHQALGWSEDLIGFGRIKVRFFQPQFEIKTGSDRFDPWTWQVCPKFVKRNRFKAAARATNQLNLFSFVKISFSKIN